MTGAGPLFAEPLPPLDVSGRLDRLRESFPDAGVDGLLVTAAANIRWLTGFTGSAGLLLVTPQRAVLTSDGRYRTQSEEQLAGAGVAQAVDIVIGGARRFNGMVSFKATLAEGQSEAIFHYIISQANKDKATAEAAAKK